MDSKPTYIPINYIYFGSFLLLLAYMSASSVFVKEYFMGSRFFFLLYAVGQMVLEISGFIFLGFCIQRYTKPIYFWVFTGSVFFLGILHVLDFLMDRVLDLSAFDTAAVVFDESLHDFIYLLDASGLPLWAWGLFFAFILSLPFLGIALYQATNWLANKKPLSIRVEWFFQAFVCIPVALFLWDASASRLIHPDAYHAFVKSLPWKFTFLQPKNIFMTPQNPLLRSPKESDIKQLLDDITIQPVKKPNIYLFIVESLREDFITSQIAPNLADFREQATPFETSVSNANGTHLSWFSIFHSQFSLFWNEYKKNEWSMGSPALQLLKKWGYQIRVYTSAQLGYYGMDQLIFGKNLSLIDSYHPFYHALPTPAWQSDQQTVETALDDLTNSRNLQEGQVFIFFWDSTHFDYSWPKEHFSLFTPFANQIAYFKTHQTTQNIEQIKNGYKNSIHYIDSLFGSFWQKLPRREEAVVAVMGDHGEEFFERGHLFHNSHLIDEQVRIPFYLKFGRQTRKVYEKPVISQMDFFPSLFDYLTGRTFAFLEGESIFRAPKWPFAMICRFNGGKTPYEFGFHNGRYTVVAQFPRKNQIFSPQALKIRSLWNCKSQDISECKLSVESWLQEEFGGAFQRLFPEEY